MEAALALLGAHCIECRGRRRACFALVTEELDVTTERNGGNFPARAVAVVEANQFRTKAKREGQHPHPGPARHQEMPEFMEENDNGQDKQKRDDVADNTVT
jgi:hypothetical protein